MHRVTSRSVAAATTNSRELKEQLSSLNDLSACEAIGHLIAQRAIEADVYAVLYEMKQNEKFAEKVGVITNAMTQKGIMILRD